MKKEPVDKLDKIEPIPEPILKECLKDKSNLIIFVGAGISCLCGYPLWDELANKLLYKCKNKYGGLTNSEIEIIKKNYDAVGKITYISSISNNIDFLISEELNKKLPTKGKKNKKRILDCLDAFKCTIITTNADTILDDLRDLSVEWKVFPELSRESLEYAKNYPSIIHMHGSITKADSMVFTLDKYVEKYSYKNGFAPYLANIFSHEENKVILFIGYSLREFQMLQYILDFDREKKFERFIYKLDGYLDCETIKKNIDIKYYKNLGIQLIPYSREAKGFDRLIDVLEAWKNTIEKHINTFQHLDIMVEQSIRQRPTKQSKEFVLEALGEITDVDYFSSNLIKSVYFKEWVKVLKNTWLFDADKNFKPCIITTDNLYKSSFWNGLSIIESYYKKYGFDSFITKLSKRVLKESARILKQDKNIKDIYLRKNTSFSIMQFLITILLANKAFLENTSIAKTIFESEIKSPFSNVNHLAYELYDRRSVLVDSNPNTVFMLYSLVLTNSKETSDYTKYYKHELMESIIKQNPTRYFSLAKDILTKKGATFYMMGSFYNYDILDSLDTLKSVSSYYLKVSSIYLDESFIKKEILWFVNSNNAYHKRIGLCLLNINFERCFDVFVDNIELFFSDDTYYSDLKITLSKNGNYITTNKDLFERIIELIKSINYENSDKSNETLKNGLFAALKPYDYNGLIPSFFITEKEEKSLNNYNKMVYSEPIDFNGIVHKFYQSIENLDIKDLVPFIDEEYKNLSSFYRRELFNAIDLYLSKKKYADYCYILRQIGSDYFKHFVFEVEYSKTISLSEDEIINLIDSLNDVEYKDNLDSIVGIVDDFSRDESKEENTIKLLSNFRYKLIDPDLSDNVIDSNKLDINLTHGNLFYRYFNILIKTTFKHIELTTKLEKQYSFFSKKYFNNHIFIFDILMFSDYLLYLIPTIFKNDILTYLTKCTPQHFMALAFVNDLNIVLQYLGGNNDFKTFLSKDEFNGEYRNNVLYRLVCNYFSTGKYKKLAYIAVATLNIESIENVYRSFNGYLDENADSTIAKRLNEFTDTLIKECSKNKTKDINIDRLIYVVSSLIESSKNINDRLWKLLIIISEFKHRHFFEELANLLINYCQIESDNVSNVLYSYVKSYEKYGFDYYIKNFIEMINALNQYDCMKSVCEDIKHQIIKKDIKTRNLFDF